MKLENEFTVGVPVGQAWAVLTDLELIAPCMPGAQLTGVNDGVYTGKVKIKVGPVSAEYAGTAQFTEKDDGAYRAVINARGRDSRGQGNATAIISAQLRADGADTVVTVNTDLTIAGRIAQFGSGMIKEVSAKLLGQFVECLEQKLGAGGPEAAGSGAGASETEGSQASGTDAGDTEPSGSQAGGSHVGDTPAGGGQAGGPTSSVTATAAAAGGSQGGSGADEVAALDLMSLAGRSIYKRLIPLVIAVIVIVVIIVILVAR
jgi:carbon monoxide dehydrogenase subunit G